MLSLDEDDYETLGYGDIQEVYTWSPEIARRLAWRVERSKNSMREYRETSLGREASRVASAKYRSSYKSKASEAKRRATEKYKKRYAVWCKSEAGKESKRKANAKAWAKKKAQNEKQTRQP